MSDVPPSPGAGTPVGRRTALALGVAAVLAAGCSATGEAPTAGTGPTPRPTGPGSDAPAGTTPGATADAETTGAGDPDTAAAAVVVATTRTLLDDVDRTLARHRGLRPLLRPAVRVHRDHLRVLADVTPHGGDSSTPSQVPALRRIPRDAGRALARLVHQEAQVETVLKQQAFGAASGPFARLLAGMAAGSAQQRARLHDEAQRRKAHR